MFKRILQSLGIMKKEWDIPLLPAKKEVTPSPPSQSEGKSPPKKTRVKTESKKIEGVGLTTGQLTLIVGVIGVAIFLAYLIITSLLNAVNVAWNAMSWKWALWLIPFGATICLFRFRSKWPLFAGIATASVVAILVFNRYENRTNDQLAQEEVTDRPEVVARTVADNSNILDVRGNPALVAAVHPLISLCESNGRQFEEDGVTPLRNRDGVDAIGKNQLRESIYRAKADSLGHNIDTEEGNDAMTVYILMDEGVGPWLTDSRSLERPECAPFIALVYGGRTPGARTAERRSRLSPSDTTITVVARREWSEDIVLPRGLLVDWMPEDAVTYELRASDGSVTTFPAVTQEDIKVSGPLNRMAFRAIDADSVIITVVAYAP